MRLTRLLSTSALIALGTLPAFAAPVASHKETAKPAAKAGTQVTAPSMMGSTSPTDYHEEHVSVHGQHRYFDGVSRTAVGGGLMSKQDSAKSVSAVTRDFISKQVPGSDPMQLIALLPGANVSASDAMGLTGSSMSLRGMDQTQVGFTLEGFPINDIGNYQVYSQEIADPENLRTVSMAQGSADLDSPHISSTGGVVDMYMVDPSMKKGGSFDTSYGSYNATRGFLRLDTGKIGNTNLRGYFSGSYASEDRFNTNYTNRKLHAETKFVNDWGNGNRISLAIIGNRLYNYLNRNVSLASWNQYGRGVKDQYVVGNTQLNSTFDPTASDKGASYYKLQQNPFTNIYASAPSTFHLSDHLTLTETPYFWYGDGNGGAGRVVNLNNLQWGKQKVSATINGQGGTTLLYNPSTSTTYRPGNVVKLTLSTGANRLMVGYWFEYSKQGQTSPYTGVGADGNPWNVWAAGPNAVMSNGLTYQFRNTLTQTRVHTMFIGDTLSLLNNKLTIDAGFKYAFVIRNGHNFLPDTSTGAYINKTWQQPLPTVAIRYQLDPENQFFVSAATNFRMPTNSALYDSGNYSTTSNSYSTRANVNQNPEISISEEAGYRYTGHTIMGSVTYFHYDFTNRLYSQTQCLDTQCLNTFSTSLNGGGQTSNGVDAEIGTRPIFYHLRPYVSFEYLDSRLGSNLAGTSTTGGSDYLPTKGKVAPEAPHYQAAFNLDYDDGHLFGGYNVKYVSKQYSTFMNDQSIPGYVLMNANIGYRFSDMSFLKAPNIRVNFSNLTDRAYLGFVKSLQGNAVNTTGINGRTIRASTPTYSIAAPFSAIATVSAGF
ncbi:TonB-dependent receptor [Neokomagataea thailandica NBRC 106555]|uniref:TonB-dependent receptor n=2 Tax=Neokomagataea TaxID=1223423 RepID=A0A4Y6V944_9PROT|nr:MULTISPECIES: TonB-dependent receptor [Neokomagataea]QDH25874.1 TonB-dependent receptor [Neokomagataea tanensis]GBR52697.1 TonB-dependent receptor [Neokomagataea thailandica NBRC 106555]